jgi:hypothetical protein
MIIVPNMKNTILERGDFMTTKSRHICLLIMPYLILLLFIFLDYLYTKVPIITGSVMPLFSLIYLIYIAIGFLLAMLVRNNNPATNAPLTKKIITINTVLLLLLFIVPFFNYNLFITIFTIRNFDIINLLLIGVYLYFVYIMIKTNK